MKKSLLINLIISLILVPISPASAGPILKVNFIEPMDPTVLEEDYSFYSGTHEVGSSQSMQAKKTYLP